MIILVGNEIISMIKPVPIAGPNIPGVIRVIARYTETESLNQADKSVLADIEVRNKGI